MAPIGRIGVQRRINLVAGHRGAESHFGGFGITDFADQDDVRVLAHHRADAVGEVELGGFGDRGLAHQRHRVFHRVFEGHDVDALGVDVVEHRVKRGGLAAAGRAGDQDDPFRAGDHQFQPVEMLLGEAEILQRHDALLPVENAQHDVFAVDGRLAGDAEIDLATGDGEADAAILRRAHLGDVHARSTLMRTVIAGQ
jgi:hypothetical protein